MTYRQLIEKAYSMLEYAYAPYSGFKVGAALECADGTVYLGCNIENASYSATLCAERTALSKAISEGRRDFLNMAVISNGHDYCMPCGTCLQVLMEFAPDLEMLCANAEGKYVCYKVSELMPHSFRLKGINEI